MSEGREFLKKVQDALREFENAVVEREKHKLLESKVTRQQAVDNARDHVVDVVVKLVTAEKMKHQK
jgi:hypothetical protein